MQLINETASEKNLQNIGKKHDDKLHFVPVSYRILGGILQSLNIKFGNFLEKLFNFVIESDPQVQLSRWSGKKLPLSMTAETDALIDEYITFRQLATICGKLAMTQKSPLSLTIYIGVFEKVFDTGIFRTVYLSL